MAYDEELASRVRDLLRGEGEDVEEKMMFGGVAFMVAGHLCCGVIRDDLMVRLGPERAAEALREPHVRPMDFTGRPMKGYVYVAAAGLRTDVGLQRWLRLARDFVATLPAR